MDFWLRASFTVPVAKPELVLSENENRSNRRTLYALIFSLDLNALFKALAEVLLTWFPIQLLSEQSPISALIASLRLTWRWRMSTEASNFLATRWYRLGILGIQLGFMMLGSLNAITSYYFGNLAIFAKGFSLRIQPAFPWDWRAEERQRSIWTWTAFR